MLVEAINQTVGIAVGTFVGVLIGLMIRARQGKRAGLLRGSVPLTALTAAMVAWTFGALLRIAVG